MEYAEWVERLGGWACVLIIVKWMMSRMDKLIDNLTKTAGAFSDFHKEFHTYKRDDSRVHEQIVAELQNLRNDARVRNGETTP